MSAGLYERMCSAIAACHLNDEAASIQGPAAALSACLKQALNTEPERMAAEIRLRAERCHSTLLRDAAGLPPRNRRDAAWLAQFEGKTP